MAVIIIMGDPGFMLSKCYQFSWYLSLLLLRSSLSFAGRAFHRRSAPGWPHGGKGTFFSLAGSCGDVAWANLSLQRAVLPGKGASVGESRPERKEAEEASDDIL